MSSCSSWTVSKSHHFLKEEENVIMPNDYLSIRLIIKSSFVINSAPVKLADKKGNHTSINLSLFVNSIHKNRKLRLGLRVLISVIDKQIYSTEINCIK